MSTFLHDARDKPCQNCGGYQGVVSAHSDLGVHGKGVRKKACDLFSAWLCQGCHDWYDGRAGYRMDPTGLYEYSERQAMWQRAFERTAIKRVEIGTIKLLAEGRV